MHDALVAASFFAMILAPCLVASFSARMEA